MPFVLRKAPKRDLHWVVKKETGEKYSKEPLPKERALAQMRALYARESVYDDMIPTVQCKHGKNCPLRYLLAK